MKDSTKLRNSGEPYGALGGNTHALRTQTSAWTEGWDDYVAFLIFFLSLGVREWVRMEGPHGFSLVLHKNVAEDDAGSSWLTCNCNHKRTEVNLALNPNDMGQPHPKQIESSQSTGDGSALFIPSLAARGGGLSVGHEWPLFSVNFAKVDQVDQRKRE